jgi:hypothetical protein
MARDKVREFLILRAVAEKEKIEITPEEIEKERSPEESEASVLDRLRNRKALELIIERADITHKETAEEDTSDDPGSEGQAPSWTWTLVEDGEAASGSDSNEGEGT